MNCCDFSKFKFRRKDSCGTRDITLSICNEISFFNGYRIIVGRLLGANVIPSFNDEIKLTVSSELIGFRKKEFSLAYWRNSWNDLFENMISSLVFSAIALT